MREKVALNEAGASYGDWWGAGGLGSEAMKGAGAKVAGDASSEDVKRQCQIGRVRSVWASNGDGPRRGVWPGAFEVATVVKGRRAGWLMGFCRGG